MPPTEKPWELTEEHITILKNSIAKGATDEELKFCLTVARRYKLDPFKQQIWFIKRWDSGADNGKGGKGTYVWTPQVGIYGMMHIAARDHSDYGAVSKPEYGPEMVFDIDGHKVKAPQWCIVKVWKKGLSEPSVGEAWFEEYCPKVWDNARLFWAKYQHRMIAKCAKAQGIREAYPDLGGLFIPEECQRVQGDYTPAGREIVDVSAGHSTRRLDETAAHGHAPGSERARQAEAALKRVAEADAAIEAGKGQPAATVPQGEPMDVTKAKPVPPLKFKGVVTLNWENPEWPRVTGDLENILPNLQENIPSMDWGRDSFWHVTKAEVPRLYELLAVLGYEVRGAQPPKSSAGNKASAMPPSPSSGATRRSGGDTGAAAAPQVVSGTIEKCMAGMSGTTPVRDITLLLADKTKPSFRCWDKSLFQHLDAGVGKAAILVLKKNKTYLNIIGLRRIGSKEWLEDGTPVLQNQNRESTKTLF